VAGADVVGAEVVPAGAAETEVGKANTKGWPLYGALRTGNQLCPSQAGLLGWRTIVRGQRAGRHRDADEADCANDRGERGAT
jgi:hypothetical protein